MDYISRYASPLGRIVLASDGEALVGLWFEGQAHFGEGLLGETAEKRLPIFDEAARWLDGYFTGVAPNFIPTLNLRGTPFRLAVWEELLKIPFGQTATYGEIARRLVDRGMTSAVPRAVGGAVGRNPISLIVPCHRVLGSDGGMTGYAGGVERKRKLLELEGAL